MSQITELSRTVQNLNERRAEILNLRTNLLEIGGREIVPKQRSSG